MNHLECEVVKEGCLTRQKRVGEKVSEDYLVLHGEALLVYKEKPTTSEELNSRPWKVFPTVSLKLYAGEEERDDGSYHFYLKVASSGINQCKFYTTSLAERDEWFTNILHCVALKVYVQDECVEPPANCQKREKARSLDEEDQRLLSTNNDSSRKAKGKSMSVSPVMFRRSPPKSPPKVLENALKTFLPSLDDLMDMYSKKYTRSTSKPSNQITELTTDSGFHPATVCS